MAQSILDKDEDKKRKELVIYFNQDGSHYLKATFLNQIWIRYNESNPGTTVFGTPKSSTLDLGLRRTRIQLFGQISDKIFVYTQFGTNNINYISPRKQGLFFLDAVTELKIVDQKLSLGSGLTGWSGLSRYASPSVGSILTLDAPLYQQSTNDINDQFLRKFSLYAKGKLGKLDYRIAISDPMAIQNSTAQKSTIQENSLFSPKPAKLQFQGYFMVQLKDKESNLTPYNVGTYLGKKHILNFGAGFISQKDAMWHLSNSGDSLSTNLGLFALDVFYDMPLNVEKGTAFTAYGSISHSDYGKNYIRNLGVMNPANGVNSQGSFNGGGNSFPIIGSGNTFYAQFGYLLKQNLLGDYGTLQPYSSVQVSNLDLLNDSMVMYEAGINWLIEGNRSKISLNYQSRPVFDTNASDKIVLVSRKGMITLQTQISI
ncbi:hypothetical protein [Peijinzhouia sedimentorum]